MRIWLSLLAWGCSAVAVHAQDATESLSAKERLFVEQLYPQLRAVQCHLCHNDNGVASQYDIAFPAANASREQIAAFGYQLIDFVDKNSVDNSSLLLKPTGRVEHTGGVRIKPGSSQEQLLKSWIEHLNTLTTEDQARAKRLIEQSQQWQFEPLSLQRLTHSQYNNSVRDLLGDQTQPANQFPKEDFIRGFKNQLDGQGISPLQAEAYGQAAERLARSVFRGGDQRKLLPISPKTATDADTAQEFVKQFGLRTFRRPLSAGELSKYTQLLIKNARPQANVAASVDDFFNGASVVIEAMLQSPHFLYRRGSTVDSQANANSLARPDPYATATRLAYLLWDTMPDQQLLEAAERDELSTSEQIEAHTRRLLSDPKSDQALHEFLSQWLRFDRVLSATRDRRRFREFNSEIASAMVEETTRLFDHLLKHDMNFMDFYTADYTFVNAPLARLYGLPEPSNDFQRVDYPAQSGRAGVLGHGTFLVSTSKPAETSPTARGIFVRNQLLAQEIAPPPPGVNSVLPEIAEDKPLTNRQRLEVHLNSEACASCHRLVDPIGYAFEQYDAIGGYHEKVQFQFGTREKPVTKELDVDTSAFVAGLPDSQFSRPKELGKLLAASDASQRCIVKQYFRYAMGREETAADAPIIEAVFASFRDSGFKFRELVVALVKQTSLL